FNNYITGETSFTHKAGMHTKAVMLNPGAYEIIDPADFGLQRTISIAHRLTGKNAIQHRAKELGLQFGDSQLREITLEIKRLADTGPLTIEQLDEILRGWVVA
ncbi:MAG TPA: homocitrate synthase, partial [Terriglobia bacterium]|nr:homocitrate synthase [Terriglobia bacterium]